MVVGAFPVAKLGTLLLRQISKPIATFAKERAKNNPFFRKYICMPPAQFYNWCEVKMKMWVMNLGKPVNIPSLNEAMAIELGANLLGEAIIFSVAAGVLFAEYARQVRKEAAKEEARISELTALTNRIQDLYFTTERQEAQLNEITRSLHHLHHKLAIADRPEGKVHEFVREEYPATSMASNPPGVETSRDAGIVTNALFYVTHILPMYSR